MTATKMGAGRRNHNALDKVSPLSPLESKTKSIRPELELSPHFYQPRTIADCFNLFYGLDVFGYNESEFIAWLHTPEWRTQLIAFRGEQRCEHCSAIISPDFCWECGEAKWIR